MSATITETCILEPWKLDLIRQRAVRMLLQPADVDDAVQEIAIELFDFEWVFDPENPATEKTALTVVIDNKLKTLVTAERCFQRRMEYVRELQRSPQRSTRCPNGPYQEPAYSESSSRAADVRDSMVSLDPPEREICQLLSEGHSIAEVAQSLGCSKTTVRLHLAKVRERFLELGINLWLLTESRDDAAAENELLLLPARKAAAMCGMSLRTWRTWDAAGFVPVPVRIGRSTFWRTSELREWIAAECPKRDVWLASRSGT